MKTRTITIPKSEIFFDVDAATHIFSRSTEGNGQQRADSLESDTGDDFNKSVVTRFADHRASELSDRIGQFITAESGAVESATAAISTTENYSFSLSVEDAFLDELMGSLADAMEKYIAHGATADWLMATGDNEGSVYAALLPADLSQILSLIVKRKTPART